MSSIDFERIEAYLNGDLNAAEKARFETEMAASPDLASAVELYRSIEQTMHGAGLPSGDEGSLKQNLDRLGARYFPGSAKSNLQETDKDQQPPAAGQEIDLGKEEGKEKKSRVSGFSPLWVKWVVAAGLLSILLLGVVWYSGNRDAGAEMTAGKAPAATAPQDSKTAISPLSTPDTAVPGRPSSADAGEPKQELQDSSLSAPGKAVRESLFARYFKPEKALESRDSLFNEGLRYYNAGDYQNAIGALEDIASAPLTRGETTDETLTIFYARYYQAISYLASGNTATAIAALKKLTSGDPFLQAKVQWYLALAYLEEGRLKAATQLLHQLARNGKAKEYQQQAHNLQVALDKN